MGLRVEEIFFREVEVRVLFLIVLFCSEGFLEYLLFDFYIDEEFEVFIG